MKKHEVIKAYCKLSGEVADKVFHWNKASDCFCEESLLTDMPYYYDEAAFQFIQDAVNEKLSSL